MTDSPNTKKTHFAKKTNVSPTPNAYFSGLHFLSRGQCVRQSILPRNCTLERASRLRRTYLFNKLHSPTSVPSTPNALFKNRVSSRLHQRLVCLKKCCLAYTKHRLWVVLCEAEPSRAEPSRARPGHSRKFWNIRPMKISTPEINKKNVLGHFGTMYS